MDSRQATQSQALSSDACTTGAVQVMQRKALNKIICHLISRAARNPLESSLISSIAAAIEEARRNGLSQEDIRGAMNTYSLSGRHVFSSLNAFLGLFVLSVTATPLSLAVNRRLEQVVKYLVSQGALVGQLLGYRDTWTVLDWSVEMPGGFPLTQYLATQLLLQHMKKTSRENMPSRHRASHPRRHHHDLLCRNHSAPPYHLHPLDRKQSKSTKDATPTHNKKHDRTSARRHAT